MTSCPPPVVVSGGDISGVALLLLHHLSPSGLQRGMALPTVRWLSFLGVIIGELIVVMLRLSPES